MSFALRDYQASAVAAAQRAFERNRSALIVCPTATGKTLIAATIIAQRLQLGRALVVAHTEELVHQAASKIARVTEKSVDIEKADQYADRGIWHDWKAPTIVASVQTLISRRGDGYRMNRFKPDEFATVWIDEAHRSSAASFRRVLAHFTQNPNVRVLGVTATPDRHDEQALGQIFDELAFEYSIHQAMDDGWIVPLTQTIVTVDGLDFSHIKTTAGDLNGAELSAELERREIVERIADPLFREAGKRRTLVFTKSVAQAHLLAEQLNNREDNCAVAIDGTTPDDYRRDMLRAYARDEFRFLVNVGCFTEGFDDPGIEVVGLARPTKSRALYCLDDETEILTPDGWRGIDDTFESAFAFDAETFEIAVSPVQARIRRAPLPGERAFGINGRHLSICVSDKHRMVGWWRHGDRVGVRLADDLPLDGLKIPVCGLEGADGIPLTDDELRFLGLVATDGNVNLATNGITLYQSERYPEAIAYIEGVLERLRFKNTRSIVPAGTTTNFGKHALHRWTISRGKPRGTDKTLRGYGKLWPWLFKENLPAIYRNITRQQLLVLLEAMNVGDGAKMRCPSINWTPRTMQICTARRQLADDIQSLCVRRLIRCTLGTNGNDVVVMHIDPTRYKTYLPVEQAGRTSWGPLSTPREFWCIQVETGFIVCRRRGKPFITGNCQMVGRGFRVLPGVVDDLTDSTAQRRLGLNGEPESMAELRRRRIAESAKPKLEILDFVGVCGKHKLACAIDIFAGKESDEVLAEATRIAKANPGKPVKDSVAEAKREIEKRARDKEEARKRKHIIGRADYTTRTVDPFGAADAFIRETPSVGGPLASAQSTDYLRKLFKHFGYDVSKVQREWGQRRVSVMIEKLKARRASGPPSNAMKWKLRELGCRREQIDAMNWTQAMAEIQRRMGAMSA